MVIREFGKRCFRLAVAVACCLPLFAQLEGPPSAQPVKDAVRFEVSETLFTAMAAINAAGYDEEIEIGRAHV